MDEMKYKIGDIVYKSGTTYSTETIQCPDCLGTKEWIITFADGQAMIIGCQTCKNGFSPASGYVTFKQWRPHVERLTIGKIYDWNQQDGFRYMCEETGIGSGSIYRESDLFSDKESAEINAKIKHEEQMKHIAQNNFSREFRGREQIENMLSTFGFTRRDKLEKTRQFVQWAKISGILTKREQALSEIKKLKGVNKMKKQDRQVALEALERNSEIFESSQKEQSICHAEFHTNQATIRSALTAQDVNKGIDLDNAREVFENWLTGNGNYPHLKHKSFGGIYIHEEAALKWDGFKAGYYARAEAQKVVGE